jgi:hypothetical protein
MKRLHLLLGLTLIVIFLLTGQYMEYVHNRLLPDGPRLLYRSRHIYILFSAFINVCLGIYLSGRTPGWRRTLQIVGSVLILLAPGLLLAGFFFEPNRGPNRTVLAPLGIFATAAGMLLHLFSGIPRREKDNSGGR